MRLRRQPSALGRPLNFTVRPHLMALPYRICARVGPGFIDLGSGRFHQLQRGKAPPFGEGFRYVLVENALAEFLRATGVEGVRFEEAVLIDPWTDEEFTTHTCLRIDECIQDIRSLTHDRPRMWMVGDLNYFVSPTLKQILEKTRWVSYLRFSDLSDFMGSGSAV